MGDTKELLQHARREFPPPERVMESLRRRRDRKRRNQRITAGVVGIAVFVAAVWIVTTGGAFDRSETSVVPGGAETGPAETAPPLAHASPKWNVTEHPCGDGAGVRLKLTHTTGHWIKVRFEVHRSPVGHSWRITIVYLPAAELPGVVFRGTRVAGDSGDFVVHRRAGDAGGPDTFEVKAVDTQTGQHCKVLARV